MSGSHFVLGVSRWKHCDFSKTVDSQWLRQYCYDWSDERLIHKEEVIHSLFTAHKVIHSLFTKGRLIHNWSTEEVQGYPQLIHSILTVYSQVIHSILTVHRVIHTVYTTCV